LDRIECYDLNDRRIERATVIRMDELEEMRELIRGAGLRATSARLAVLRVLRRAESPLSHAEIAEILAEQGIDKATIFRNLADLTECNLASRSELGDHVWRFEAVDPDHPDDGHPHFVCTTCGTVSCLADPELEKTTRRSARKLGRVVEVLLRGVCRECAPK
jgi:Fur family transcriptional regulator, ferric uptake regulator